MAKKKQFIVWGLGRFDSSIALTLAELGHEVMGVDNNEDVVETLADTLTHVVLADAIDEKTVQSLGVKQFDAAIVAIGTLEPSLLCTMLMKEAGVKTIIAKASNVLHGKMLKRLGATQVISPEMDMGRRVAHALAHPNIQDYVELSDDMCLVEVILPQKMVGKSLVELNIRQTYQLNVVAVKHPKGKTDWNVNPKVPLQAKDVLVVLGSREGAEKLEGGI